MRKKGRDSRKTLSQWTSTQSFLVYQSVLKERVFRNILIVWQGKKKKTDDSALDLLPVSRLCHCQSLASLVSPNMRPETCWPPLCFFATDCITQETCYRGLASPDSSDCTSLQVAEKTLANRSGLSGMNRRRDGRSAEETNDQICAGNMNYEPWNELEFKLVGARLYHGGLTKKEMWTRLIKGVSAWRWIPGVCQSPDRERVWKPLHPAWK